MTKGRSLWVATVVVSSILGLAVARSGASAATAESATPDSAIADHASAQALRVHYLGQTNVSSLAAATKAMPATAMHPPATTSHVQSPPDAPFAARFPRTVSAGGASLQLGNPGTLAVTSGGAAQAFDGIDHTDSRLAYNGNQPNGEPPDGDLCAGTTAEVEILNDALQFFSPLGNILTPPIADNQFMGLPPEIDWSTTPVTFPGPQNEDINCVYDSTSDRFFLMTWGLDPDPSGTFLTGTQAYYVAAQATADPVGAYNLFKVPVEAPDQPDCAGFCLADYPQSSTDASSYYVSYDRFNQGANDFDGGRILALSKQALLAGTLAAGTVINPGSIGGALAGPFLGAQVVPGSPELTQANGTHYFVTALDPNGSGGTAVGLVALTNTAAIDTNPQAIGVQTAVVHGVLPFAFPPKLRQKPGPRPLGTNMSMFFPGAPNEPLRRLDGGADWTQPAKFANGQIWTVIDTRLADGNSGLLWLAIKPASSATSLNGAVTHEGYLGAGTSNLAYGDIAVDATGSKALIVASLVGPTTYPSAIYTTFSTRSQPTALHEYLAGARPDDGQSCYYAYIPGDSQRGCRWGDYSMANVSPTGVFWFETEYITARARKAYANWGTAIGRLPVPG